MFLLIPTILALRCEPVHASAVMECPLRGSDVTGRPAPSFECAVLQRAAVGEGERPGESRHSSHFVEVRRRCLVTLAPGKEHDAGQGRRNSPFEATHRFLRDPLYAGL